MTVDANNKVKPRLDGQLGINVAQDLESIGAVGRSCARGLRWRVGVKTSNEAVERTKHGCGYRD